MPAHVHQSHCVIGVELQGCFVIHQSFFPATWINKMKDNTPIVMWKKDNVFGKSSVFLSPKMFIQSLKYTVCKMADVVI